MPSNSTDYKKLLEEKRRVAAEEAATFERKRQQRERELEDITKKIEKQEQDESRRRDKEKAKRLEDDKRRKLVEARIAVLNDLPAGHTLHRSKGNGALIHRTGMSVRARKALKKEIELAVTQYQERDKKDVNRYGPHQDGYNYAAGTRWEDDDETACTRCAKARKICWRRVITDNDTSRTCLRCKDLHISCDSDGLPGTLGRKRVREEDSEEPIDVADSSSGPSQVAVPRSSNIHKSKKSQDQDVRHKKKIRIDVSSSSEDEAPQQRGPKHSLAQTQSDVPLPVAIINEAMNDILARHGGRMCMNCVTNSVDCIQTKLGERCRHCADTNAEHCSIELDGPAVLFQAGLAKGHGDASLSAFVDAARAVDETRHRSRLSAMSANIDFMSYCRALVKFVRQLQEVSQIHGYKYLRGTGLVGKFVLDEELDALFAASDKVNDTIPSRETFNELERRYSHALLVQAVRLNVPANIRNTADILREDRSLLPKNFISNVRMYNTDGFFGIPPT